MPQPLIGISTERNWNGPRRICGMGGTYPLAVMRAGGIPVLLPVQLSEKDIPALLGRIHGLIVTGGPDINPALYGERMHPNVKGVDVCRDETDLALVRAACEHKVPLLGICRGFQVINVAFGGQLYTDVNEQHENGLFHTCYPDLPYDLYSHPVRLEQGGKLARIFKLEEIQVNSLHHQGVRRPGKGLIITATAPDGLVEGVEIPDHPFGLGVQWHPELMPDDPPSQVLFRAFIQAAAVRI